MTDRIRHLTITLDQDYRDDDVKPIVEALRLIRGVSIVEEHVVTAQDQIARSAVRSEIEHDLHRAIDQVFTRKNFERTVAERKDRS